MIQVKQKKPWHWKNITVEGVFIRKILHWNTLKLNRAVSPSPVESGEKMFELTFF